MEPDYQEAELTEVQAPPPLDPGGQRRPPIILLGAAGLLLVAVLLIISSGPEQPGAPEPKPLTPAQKKVAPYDYQEPGTKVFKRPVPPEIIARRVKTIVRVLRAENYPERYRYKDQQLVDYLNQQLPFAVQVEDPDQPGEIKVQTLGYLGVVQIKGQAGKEVPLAGESFTIWE